MRLLILNTNTNDGRHTAFVLEGEGAVPVVAAALPGSCHLQSSTVGLVMPGGLGEIAEGFGCNYLNVCSNLHL